MVRPEERPTSSGRSWQKRLETFVLAYETLGVVYGDLATSPLYVYPTMNLKAPQAEDYLGTFSIVFWTLTLIGLVKYVFIVLQADDNGEGGTFALYSLISRRLGLLDDYSDENRIAGNRSKVAGFIQRSKAAQKLLLFVAMLGTCMLIGDGILTPAVSVLSAMDGIGTATTKVKKSSIVWLSAVILIALFVLQRYGTKRVSFLFSPIMALWLIFTPIIGVYNIANYNPQIYKALSPHHIYFFFRRNRKDGWMALGGTVLCITGAEAMFADLGHFSRSSIQVAFSLMIYPSVILTYAGQSAYLSKFPDDHSQAFYKSVPRSVYWPMFVVSTLSAIVASQGLISAAFSIIKQSMLLDYFPPVKLVHTSLDKEGQVYSPHVNYCLMVLCLAVLFGFKGGPEIGNAFGVAVISVMLITSVLITLVMLTIWRVPPILALLYISIYGALEGVYFSAVLTKLEKGGWLPFAIAVLLAVVMYSWNRGKVRKSEYEMVNKMDLDSLEQLFSCAGNQRVPGLCIFYTDLVHGVPPIVRHYVNNVRSFHQVIIFVTTRYKPVKTVGVENRFQMEKLGYRGLYRCVVYYGYTDVLEGEELVKDLVGAIKACVQVDNQDVAGCIADIEMAKEAGAIHVVGKADFKTSEGAGLFQRVVLDGVYRFLRNNFQAAAGALRIPTPTLVEVGMVYEV